MVSFAPVLSLFSSHWFYGFAVAIFGGFGCCFAMALKNDASRAKVAQHLAQDPDGSPYGTLVTSLLAAIDRQLTPANAEDTPTPDPDSEPFRRLAWLMKPLEANHAAAVAAGKSPWNWPLLDFSMRLGVVYPVVLMILVGTTGGAGKLSALRILPGNSSDWVLAVVGFSLMSLAAGMTLKLLPRDNRLALAVIGSSLALFFANGFAFTGAFGFAFAVAIAVAVSFAGAAGIAGAVAVAFAVAFEGSFALGVAGAVSVTALVAWMVRSGRGLFGYLGLIALLSTFLILGAAVSPAKNSLMATVLFFSGATSLTSALCYFLTMGTTRILASISPSRGFWAIPTGIASLGIAALLSVALSLLLILAIHGLNSVADAPLLELQPLFDSLRDSEARVDHLWLIAMVFSTLLPTLLHLAISTWSAIAWIPRGPKRWLLAHWPAARESTEREIFVVAGLSLMATVSVMLPIVLSWWGVATLYRFHPEIGGGYLFLFESFAQWIGAAVEPGPLILET